MNTPYTFSILRYVHDVLTGEFANVGIVLYAPREKFLRAICTTHYGRLSQFFGSVNGRYVRRVLQHIEEGINEFGQKLATQLPLEPPPKDALACAHRILPPDDSALQFSELRAGVAKDLEVTLDLLFERYVERYSSRSKRSTRLDDDILPILKQSLTRRQVYLEPKLIVAPNYQHEFPLAWKNGAWNACDAVSFDLSDASDILEKANRWLGRAHTLRESKERFKLILFLGQPQRDNLWDAFQKAENILNTMPGPFELVREAEVGEFAEHVEQEVKNHDSASS